MICNNLRFSQRKMVFLLCTSCQDIEPSVYFFQKLNEGVSTSGKSADFDSAIRRFESCHPYHNPKLIMKRIALVSGTSTPELAKSISNFLDVPLLNPQLIRFANGEIFCEIEKNVRGADVFIVQSLCPPVMII